MNCRYIYGTQEFDTELELDDFLLSKGPELLDKYGDEVFQELTTVQMRWMDAIDPIATQSRNRSKGKKVYDTILQTLEEELNDRVAVTKFLSGLKVDGKYLFPKFDENEYFAKRIKKWTSNDEKRFTEKELQDFAEEPEFKDNKIPEVMTQELIERLIKIEKEKWENEAEIGTAIHDLCELFFKRKTYDVSNLRIWGDEDDDTILEMFTRRADNRTLQLLDTSQRKQVLKYCRTLREEIESSHAARINGKKVPGKFIYFPELKITANAVNPETGERTKLSGSIDLLVVPVDGDPFIIDYKVSPANYDKEAPMNVAPEDLDPNEYNIAKKLAFRYQLATYGRMLKSQNIAFRGMKTYVAPIQLLEYKRKNGNWNFGNIRTNGKLLDDLTQDAELTERIQKNLDSIFVDIGIAQIDDQDILKNIKNTIKGWFTQYRAKELGWSFQEVQELIEDSNNKYEENKEADDPDKRFSYKIEGLKRIYAKSKAELIGKIQAETESSGRFLLGTVNNFINAVKSSNEPTRAYSNRLEHQDGDAAWYSKVIRKYIKNGQYQVLDLKDGVPDVLKDLGIVLLKNNHTDNIEVLKFTNEKVDAKVDRRNVNKLITQALGVADIVDKSGKNFLLDAVHGNVAIMEALLALNYVNPDVFTGSKIHSIKVINPFFNSGLTASNKQILNSFKTLLKYKTLSENFGHNRLNYAGHEGVIKFCTSAEQAIDSLRTGFKIIEGNREGRNLKTAQDLYNRCLTPLEQVFFKKDDEPLDVVGETQTKVPKTKAEAIYNAILEIEDVIKGIQERTLQDLDFDITDDEIQAQYQALLRAYAEELGYDFKQQVKAFDNYKDSMNILLEGHSGLRTDNPGTTASDNLNKITEFIDDCYKRVTDFMQKPHAVTQNLIKKLKKEKRISYLGDSTFQNSIKIYDNMTNLKTRKAGDDWLFVNPWDSSSRLTKTESDLLKQFILGINTNRFKKKGESNESFKQRMIGKLNEGDVSWLRVPLSYKGTQGKLETQGLFVAAKDYFNSWKPKQVKERLKKEMSHLLTPEGKQLKDDIYAMRTRFDKGEDPRNRAEMLKEIDIYDHDLQSVFLKHMFGYKLKEESMKAFTLIKAAHADIILQEFTQNRKRGAEKDYLLDNVKIMAGRNLMEGDSLIIYEYAKKLMRAMSVSALGFNPKQIYQLLEGIWKDIGIVWRNEDGRYGFTFSEMLASFANTYKEMKEFGYTPTKLERLNQLYRINDMDINVYAEHLQNSHNLIRNFSTFIFRFASRPDFYNRMTIFQAYMRHDGTFDAYQLNKEGELEYHFEKDARFSALAKGNTNDPKYREQEALYRAMARQFEIEGAIYADGTKFELEPPSKNGVYKPLPQAYTNKQARSYKAMSDKMYGYYSHEKRALMQSSLIGALFWQMNTYWSGKKNQWFAISSVKDRGHFTHYSEVELDENNKPIIEKGKEKRKYYYYQVDSNGNIKFDEPPVTEEELINKEILVPFYTWEGSFSEGIMVTLSSILFDSIALGLQAKNDLIRPKGGDYQQLIDSKGNPIKDPSLILQAVVDQYWNNPNENLRTAYRQNIKQFVYDMSVLLIIGGLVGSQIHLAVNEYNDEHKDDHTVKQAMARAALALSEAIFESSTLDFDPTESIGGRGVNWTPFAIASVTRLYKTWSRVLSGDQSFSRALMNSFSFNKFTTREFIKQLHDPEVVDHEGEEPTEEEQHRAISEYITLTSATRAYAQ